MSVDSSASHPLPASVSPVLLGRWCSRPSGRQGGVRDARKSRGARCPTSGPLIPSVGSPRNEASSPTFGLTEPAEGLGLIGYRSNESSRPSSGRSLGERRSVEIRACQVHGPEAHDLRTACMGRRSSPIWQRETDYRARLSSRARNSGESTTISGPRLPFLPPIRCRPRPFFWPGPLSPRPSSAAPSRLTPASGRGSN